MSLVTACSSPEGPRAVPQDFDTGIPIFDAAQKDSAREDGTSPTDTDVDSTAPPTDSGADSTMVDTAVSDAPASDILSTKDTAIDAVVVGDSLPDSLGTDTGPPDASPALVPVGKVCTASAECDPTGAKVGICSNAYDPPDTVDPTPTCMALACEAGLAGIGKPCGAGGAGVCVSGGAAGVCVDACSFGASGAASGCATKTVCRVVSYAREAGATKGVGSCSGGCTANGDCTAGQKCQTETGACVQTLQTFGKAFGAACTSASECPCVHDAGKPGFCSKFCITGGSMCPTGYTCDAGLPKTDVSGTLFSSSIGGLAGDCLKDCASDLDCAFMSGRCDANTATGTKVCRLP